MARTMLNRFSLSILYLIVFAAIGTARAVTVADLYRAAPAVTGVDEPERQRGFRRGLEEVIVRVTGDASLKGSYRIEPLLDFAPNFVVSYTYKDEMESVPKRGEQGARDRPHTLTIQFDKAKLDSAIEAFGLRIWSAERPLTAVFLGVKDARGVYVLTSEGDAASGQREVLQAVSIRLGTPILLPAASTPPLVSYEAVATGDTDALTAAARMMGADSVLFGSLEYDGLAYWSIDWTLIWFGHDIQTWENRGVTFDMALREALEKSARLYSVFAAR